MYRTFEIRHFTTNPAANGESDFLGPTSVLSTPERIGFLSAFATTAKRFFAQERWDRPAVAPTAVAEALAQLKPQPAPQVRRRIAIDRWRWLGSREGASRTDATRLAHWQAQKDLLAPGDGTLGFARAAQAVFAFPGQEWRFLVRLRLQRSKGAGAASIAIGGALVLEIGGDGALSVDGRAIADLPADRWVDVRCEVSLDAEARCVNVEVDGRQALQGHPVVPVSAVERLVVAGTPGWQVGDVWVQTYQPNWHVHTQIPLTMTTVVNETFLVRPPVQGWQTLDYDDALWPETDAPFAYGGERHQGEDLHLRRVIDLALAALPDITGRAKHGDVVDGRHGPGRQQTAAAAPCLPVLHRREATMNRRDFSLAGAAMAPCVRFATNACHTGGKERVEPLLKPAIAGTAQTRGRVADGRGAGR